MAIKFNTYTIGNRKNINADMAKTSMQMNYTLNTESTWINCNYPEHITSTSMLGDSNLGNKCIFTGKVKPGIVQVFYSHFNETGEDINYGIQIFNPNNDPNVAPSVNDVTITLLNGEHASGDWYTVCAKAWANFFKGYDDFDCKSQADKDGVLPPLHSNGVCWLTKKSIHGQVPFSGNFRFEVDRPVIVTVYAYKDFWKLNGTAKMYPYSKTSANNRQYSGISDGFFFTSSKLTFNSESLISETKRNNGVYFTTHHEKILAKVNGVSKSDLIPIRLLGSSDNLVTSPTQVYPLENLGNWCAQYAIPIRLYNNSGKKVRFRGFFRTPAPRATTDDDKISIICVLSSGWGNVTYGVANNYEYNAWNWLTVELDNGKYLDDNYQFILGTNSTRNVQHIWTAEYM